MKYMELKIEKLGYGYGYRQLFQDVSFSLTSGNVLTILGINGAGKTTLVKCIMQFITDYQGNVLLDNKQIKEFPVRKRAELIGYVAPNDISEYDITVLDYISLGLASKVDYLSCPSDAQYHSILQLCDRYSFQHLLNRKVKSLSQGERQMASVLRVLTQDPSVIVFDEPTAALDLKNQKDLLELVIQLKEQGKIVIQISHNPNHVFQVGGKVLLLFSDKSTFGDVNETVTDSSLSELYGTNISIQEINGRKIVLS